MCPRPLERSSSDHNAVDFELCADNMTQIRSSRTSTYKVYLWSEGDYDSMCRYLRDVKWDDLLTTNFTSDSIWSAFCDILNEACSLPLNLDYLGFLYASTILLVCVAIICVRAWGK